MTDKTPLFLDFEASSLNPLSWPIEWGISWLDSTNTVQTKGGLIKPHKSFNMIGWSKESEVIHGISLDTLQNEGQEAQNVANTILGLTQNGFLISDAPRFEAHWLQALFDIIKTPLPSFTHLHTHLFETLGEKGKDSAFEYLEKTHVPHRAPADSAIMATAWKRGLDVDAGRVHYGP